MAIFRFSRWRQPPSWIFQIWNLQQSDGSRGPICFAMPNLVEIGQNAAEIWRFLKRWPSSILDLLCVCSDHSRRAFGGLYRCAKFGWNRCSSFDNMHVFRFREFGLKTPIHPHPPNWSFFGGYYPINGEQYQRNPKRHILAQVRFVWAIIRENPSTRLTCRWVPRRGHT